MGDSNLRCDFCSTPGPFWRYPARSFVSYCAPNIASESVAIGQRVKRAMY
jgi:hypothetical protein